MAIIGQLTLDQVSILEVDSDPSVGGVSAPIGSIATLYDTVNGRLWIKSGGADTAWSIITRLASGTALTPGTIQFTDANGFTTGNAKLTWDDVNARISVGAAALATPQSTIHIDNGTATPSSIRFTVGSTTGQTAGDGFQLGVDAAGNAEIIQRENSAFNFYTNNIRVMRLNASGELIIGTNAVTTDISGLGTFPQFQIIGSSIGDVQMAGIKYGADTLPPVFNLLKSRGVQPAQGLLSPDDEFGRLQFRGSDGNNFQAGASVRAAVDGTAAAGSMPGRLILMTTPTGSTAPVERIRIDQAGNVGIGNIVPTRQLDVAGTLRIRGGSPSIGNVLQTLEQGTVTGLADWTDPNDINEQITFADDFIHDVQAGTLVGIGWILAANGGTVTSPTTNVDSLHPGIVQLNTTGVQQPLIYLNSNSNISGGGTSRYQMLVKTPAALPTGTQNYIIRAGTGDNIANNATDYVNGIYFEFPASGTTAIQCKTAAANTRTTTSSGVNWTVNTWYLLEFTTTPGSVVFRINGNIVATNTTNIPAGATNYYGPIFKLMKTAGATAVAFYIDAFRWTKYYNGNRY